MKSFFRDTLSTIVGLFIFSLITILIVIFSISQIYEEEEIIVEKNSVLKIDFNKSIVDRGSDNPFASISPMNTEIQEFIELEEILEDIDKAKEHKNIKGIYLKISSFDAGVSHIEEIHDKLLEFKESGKFIYAYSESYSQWGYYLASVADKVYLNPEGNIQLVGISAGVMFYKEFLEKIGVEAQVIRHGKYKSAVEPFLYNSMSEENRVQLEDLYNSIMDNMIAEISRNRNISAESISESMNKLLSSSASKCQSLSLIDGIYYEDQVLDILRKEIKELKFIDYSDFRNVKFEVDEISDNKIAIIYALGSINTGTADINNIGSETTVKAIQKAKDDKNVKAIVLRINSPGGSALASDIIWRELELAKKEKPIVVSMGDYAASGGYYIACNANKIYANANTITGSIGVFGIVPNFKELMNEKLGIYIDTVNTHKYSDIGRGDRKLTEYETGIIRGSIEDVYTTFISRVARGRSMSKLDVDKLAQGRVWSGKDAVDIGLVDEIGGLEDAIQAASQLADIKDYRVIILPQEEDLFEKIFSNINVNNDIEILELFGFSQQKLDQLRFLFSDDFIQARMPFIIDLN